MKIKIATYNSKWPILFDKIKKELQTVLKEVKPTIEHIGSTAVPDLAAKPIIDIAIGLSNFKDLEKTITPMVRNNYIYYEAYNSTMPLRRFFVGLKDQTDHLKFKSIYVASDNIPHDKILSYKLCHVHIWELGTAEWIRHLAFRDYLIENPTIKTQYEKLKKQLSLKTFTDGNDYNNGKNRFIKAEESKAILWYNERKNT